MLVYPVRQIFLVALQEVGLQKENWLTLFPSTCVGTRILSALLGPVYLKLYSVDLSPSEEFE